MRFVLFFCIMLYSLPYAIAEKADDSQYAGTLMQDPDSETAKKKKVGAEYETYHLIDQQNKAQDSGNRNTGTTQANILTGQTRAQQMVDALKDAEFQKALTKINARSNKILEENPELRTPLTILIGTISLWTGNTIRLIKGDSIKVYSRVEGRTKTGEFRMESPLLNGKLHFQESDGFQMSMNRTIHAIDTRADFLYNAKNQSVGGELTHQLMPHIDLTFGSTQVNQTRELDQHARIQYNLNF